MFLISRKALNPTRNVRLSACHVCTGVKVLTCFRCAFKPCSENSTRERIAYPLRQPGEAKECPPTKETEPCKLNNNCFHYSYNITGESWTTWPSTFTSHTEIRHIEYRVRAMLNYISLSDWSTCQLSERAVCGNGIKTRMLDCVRSDGKSVDLSFCKEVRRVSLTVFKYLFLSLNQVMKPCDVLLQLGLERKWQMNASCVVECPVNCQLSDWSTWSECTNTCGLGGMSVCIWIGGIFTWGLNCGMRWSLHSIIRTKSFFVKSQNQLLVDYGLLTATELHCSWRST